MSSCIYKYGRGYIISPGYNICPAASYPGYILLHIPATYIVPGIYNNGPGCCLSRDRHVMAANAALALYCILRLRLSAESRHALLPASSASASVLRYYSILNEV